MKVNASVSIPVSFLTKTNNGKIVAPSSRRTFVESSGVEIPLANLNAAFPKRYIKVAQPLTIRPKTILSGQERIIDALAAHATKQNCSLTKNQICHYVAWGELILGALTKNGQEGGIVEKNSSPGELQLEVEGKQCTIKSDVFTATAITWAIYAMLEQQGRPLLDEGSFVMKDPQHRIGEFLKSAPTCYERISSHYNERAFSTQPRKHGAPVQYGVENYRRHFPGEGGGVTF